MVKVILGGFLGYSLRSAALSRQASTEPRKRVSSCPMRSRTLQASFLRAQVTILTLTYKGGANSVKRKERLTLIARISLSNYDFFAKNKYILGIASNV